MRPLASSFIRFLLAGAPALLASVTSMRGAEEFEIRSGPERVSLLELYSSEGCSSCPPAEQWLGELRKDPRLWRSIVPVAFHVDYWDGLGWKDRFAQPQWTARQRAYAAAWGGGSVCCGTYSYRQPRCFKYSCIGIRAARPEGCRSGSYQHTSFKHTSYSS
jgi:hypothetical protein